MAFKQTWTVLNAANVSMGEFSDEKLATERRNELTDKSRTDTFRVVMRSTPVKDKVNRGRRG